MKYILLVLSLVLIAFSGCSKSRHSYEIETTQQQLLEMVPSEAQFIMYMNISDIKNSSYWKDYLSTSLNDYKENFWVANFRRMTGKPIENYISDFMLAGIDTERSIKIYRFTNGVKDLKKYLRNRGYFKEYREGDRTYYQSQKNKESFFTFDEASILVTFNWRAGLDSFIAKRYTSLKENKNFIEVIEQITKKDQYWMATDHGTFASAMMRKILASNGYSQVIKVLSTVNSISFAADFTKNINVESVWGCNDPASSGLIAAAARSAIAMDLFSDKEYALGKIMDKVSVETDASDVVFKIKLNKNDIKELKTIADKRNLDKKL